MPVVSIDHANIRTTNVAGTLAFFRDVLEMEPSLLPGMTSFEEADLVMSENVIDSIGLRQIFVTELNGILLELNFWND